QLGKSFVEQVHGGVLVPAHDQLALRAAVDPHRRGRASAGARSGYISGCCALIGIFRILGLGYLVDVREPQ
ncbi:MAG: hypothetical protein H5U02_11695, partial [Clostridia bacterium]|nr:hypothetical protein [Clostridia bacterium]